MRMRNDMPRPRKYDYKKDKPVRCFIDIPTDVYNELEEKIDLVEPKDFQKELSKIVERFLREYVKSSNKKD